MGDRRSVSAVSVHATYATNLVARIRASASTSDMLWRLDTARLSPYTPLIFRMTILVLLGIHHG